jgi:phosphopantetheinyl transferase
MKAGAVDRSMAVVSALALGVFALNINTSRAQNSLQSRQEIARNECAQRAFTSYVTANNSLLQQQGAAPLQSVEMTIAQRRLQEQFCLQFARCLFPDPSNEAVVLPYTAAFGSCLRDEALEKYDAVPRSGD